MAGAILKQALPGAAPGWTNPYAGALEEANAAAAAPQTPMFTPEQQQQRQDANRRASRWGLLGLSMGDEGQARAGAQVLQQALAARQERVTDQGTFNPITGQMSVNPEHARQRAQTRQERLQDMAARAGESHDAREDTQAFQRQQLGEQIASRNQNAQLHREGMQANREAQDMQRQAGQADKLSDDFMRLSKNDLDIKGSYSDLKSLPAGGAGDVAFIFRYMKLLDPTSVVREGEFETAKKTQGIPDRVWQSFQALKRGGFLSEAARADMLNGAAQLSVGADKRLGERTKFFGDRATALKVPMDWVIPQYARGVSQEDAGGDPGAMPAPAGPVARPQGAPATNATNAAAAVAGPRARVTDAASFAALPSGTVFIDPTGAVRTKP